MHATLFHYKKANKKVLRPLQDSDQDQVGVPQLLLLGHGYVCITCYGLDDALLAHQPSPDHHLEEVSVPSHQFFAD